MYRLKILVSLLFFIYCSAHAVEAPQRELIWAQNNAPPFFITEGPNRGQGFGDPMQRMLEEELPGFQHITRQMPLRRLNQFWKQGANYCFATMIHQPLKPDANYILSIPNVFYRPHGIIATRNNSRVQGIKTRHAEHFPAYSLSYFFQEPEIRFGLMSNRTFGPTIDPLLNAHKDKLEIYDRSDADGLEGLFDMLKVGRVDYLIDYPFVFRYYDHQKSYRDHFQFIPLHENRDEGVWGAVGCSKNNWGEERIAAINTAITRLIDRQDYRELMIKWHAAEGEEERYWKQLQHRVQQSPHTIRDTAQ